MDGEEGGTLHSFHASGLVVAYEVHEGLGSVNASLILVVKHTQTIGAGHLQLRYTVVRGESHGEGSELGLLGIRDIIGVVPGKSHGTGAVGESLELLGGSVAGAHAHGAVVDHVLEQLQGLDVVGAVNVVGAAIVGDKVVGVQVVHQCTGALVTALSAAVDDAGLSHGDGAGVHGVLQGLTGGHEIVGGPGAGLLVDVLQGAGGLKGFVVDGHAVGCYGQREHVVSAIQLGHLGNSVGNVGTVGLPQII